MEDAVNLSLIDDLEDDPTLNMAAVDNADFIYLDIEEDDWGNIYISGYTYHLKHEIIAL